MKMTADGLLKLKEIQEDNIDKYNLISSLSFLNFQKVDIFLKYRHIILLEDKWLIC